MDECTKRTTILLVRHGECKGNFEGLFRGRFDFPLNETGFRQADEVAKELVPFQPRAVYTSPLLRAKQTGEAIAEATGAPLLVEEGFNNISLGVWEGRSKKEIAFEYPEQWRTWLVNPEELSIEGGESMNDVLRRSKKSLDHIVHERHGETIVVVSHRTVVRPLIAGCIGIGAPYFWRMHMETAAYSILFHDLLHEYSLYALNRTAHLSSFTPEWV